MKILYLGTICNIEDYQNEIKDYKVKPTVAPLVLETALVNGFWENEADIDILTFPIFPTFGKCPKLFWGQKREKLDCGYENVWLSAINITGLKQKSFEISSKYAIEKWIKENEDEDKAILIYSIFEPIAKSVIKCARKYNIPCFAIVADLPRDMYNVGRIGRIKKILSDVYVKCTQKIQGLFDGYIYLSEPMKEVINPTAPYIVMEGVADISNVSEPHIDEKYNKRVIMYAGTLIKLFGLDKLIEAFEQIENDELELWIFGSGEYAEEIKQHSQKDKRIKFLGRKRREEILEYEKKATLLVNVRNCNDEFTKYSFPSKTIEYMLSGTPVLTTELPGIPGEYFDYVFSIKDNNVETIKDKLSEILSQDDEQLIAIGKRAQEFIIENKSGYKQAKKIIDFIEENNFNK